MTAQKIRSAASCAGRGGMGCYNQAVLQQHLLLSLVPYGIILRRRLLPPPHPCLFLCPLQSSSTVRHPSSAAHHLLLAFVVEFTAQSSLLSSLSPLALVASFTAPPSDLLHGPPPAVRAPTLPPPSLLQPPPHPNCSCCAVLFGLNNWLKPWYCYRAASGCPCCCSKRCPRWQQT